MSPRLPCGFWSERHQQCSLHVPHPEAAGHRCSGLGTTGSSCLTSQAHCPPNTQNASFLLLSLISHRPQRSALTSHQPPAFTSLWFSPCSTAPWTFQSQTGGPNPPLPSPSCFQLSYLEVLNLGFLLEVPEELFNYINAWVLLQTKRTGISKVQPGLRTTSLFFEQTCLLSTSDAITYSFVQQTSTEHLPEHPDSTIIPEPTYPQGFFQTSHSRNIRWSFRQEEDTVLHIWWVIPPKQYC